MVKLSNQLEEVTGKDLNIEGLSREKMLLLKNSDQYRNVANFMGKYDSGISVKTAIEGNAESGKRTIGKLLLELRGEIGTGSLSNSGKRSELQAVDNLESRIANVSEQAIKHNTHGL